MKDFDWNHEKNELLKVERDICFEDIVVGINEGKLLDILFGHPNPKKFPKQKMFIVAINHYAYLVPFVDNEKVLFLKTIIPSRKATKQYLIK